MKPSAKPFHLQLNLPLLNAPAAPVPDEKQKELTLALMKLLINAARENIEPPSHGGDQEFETHA
jgi:hypothetical protein